MSVPRRSDARRNRAEILRVASEALVLEQEMVPLERVARLAGLGPATVYRHFSDQYALVVGVMEQQLEVLAQVVAEHEDDPAAFRWLMRTLLESEAAHHPLVLLGRRLPLRQQQAFVGRLVRILTGPFQRCRDAGLLRRDVDLTMLLTLQLTMLDAAIATAGDKAAGLFTGGDETAEWAINLMLDGLFVPEEPVPEEPVPAEPVPAEPAPEEPVSEPPSAG